MICTTRVSRARLLRPLGALLAVVMLASPLAAQQPPSLADIARKEAERRKALQAPSKVYTKDDLPKGTPVAPPPAPAASADAKPAAPEAAKPKDDEKNEAWWKARMSSAREELRRNEMFAAALQSRINSLAADFASRDDPAQRALVGEERNKALAEMQRVQTENASLKKQMTDLEEEARVAGVPPGWIR